MSIGSDAGSLPDRVVGPPVKVLNPGDCVTHRSYLVRSDILPEYQTCCEQRDLLNQAIDEMSKAPHDGIITSSPVGDILVGGLIGFSAGLLIKALGQWH